jgi:tetratricopeptide (TPR) repeat protein
LIFINILSGQALNSPPSWSAGFNPIGGQGVSGEIRNLRGSATDLMVVVNAITSARPVQQAPVDSNGFFQLGALLPGLYVVRLIHLPDQTILDQTVQVGENNPSITLQLPERAQESRAETVSADRLHHPLTRKGAKMIRAAQAYAEAGDHERAIEELKHALAEPSAVGYAHSILGTEYLKKGQPVLARQELEQALQMLPHDPVLHSNLGYALWLTGDSENGEREVRKALDLDHNSVAAQRLLGYILKSCGAGRQTCAGSKSALP